MAKAKKKTLQEKLERLMEQMAQAKVNDAVKLAFLSEEDRDLIDKLDLAVLSEFRRAGNGAVEMKFTDRMKIIERLLAMGQEESAQRMIDHLTGDGDE